MKILSTNNQLEKELLRCIEQYQKIDMAVAWASANTLVFNKLFDSREKIGKAIIGTHFYQTDSNVLYKFYKNKSVKFITQPSGVFHPKLYVFQKDDFWEAIIGSPNLTRGALTNNNEISLLVNQEDKHAKQTLNDISNYIYERLGSTPILRTLQRSLIIGKRSVYVEEKKI